MAALLPGTAARPGRSPRRRLVLTLLLAVALLAASCGDDDTTTTAEPTHTVRNVPDDYPTIQEAVDAADPGDLVLIGPGTYAEGVVVQTEDLVIRGTDRNEVILDGGYETENGIIIFSDGVAVENMTVRNYTSNALFWTGDYEAERTLTGYRASYITAHNNGNYGIYAFNATKGQIDNSYGSNSPDSGFYIGQCNPCDALIVDILSENSMLGYSGTNSTGVTIARSEFRNNYLGVVPNSQDGEELAPNAGTTLIGNYIHDNNNAEVPGNNDDFRIGLGTGVILIGVENNVVERNTIVDNHRFGVIILPWIGEVFGGSTWEVVDNRVVDNYIRGAEEGADIALGLIDSASTGGNCFADNDFETSLPEDLETIAPCEGEAGSGFATIDQYIDRFPQGPEYLDYQDMPAPELDFENMPDAASAPPQPATNVPMEIDLDAIERPEETPAG
jgi:hypothetical protein